MHSAQSKAIPRTVFAYLFPPLPDGFQFLLSSAGSESSSQNTGSTAEAAAAQSLHFLSFLCLLTLGHKNDCFSILTFLESKSENIKIKQNRKKKRHTL